MRFCKPNTCRYRSLFTICNHCILSYVYVYYKNKNWLQFLFIVKAAVIKQQISQFYLPILSTEDSFYIYVRPLTEINVIASFCALNLQIKFWYLLFSNGGFYNEEKRKSVFVFIICKYTDYKDDARVLVSDSTTSSPCHQTRVNLITVQGLGLLCKTFIAHWLRHQQDTVNNGCLVSIKHRRGHWVMYHAVASTRRCSGCSNTPIISAGSVHPYLNTPDFSW